MPLFTVVDAQKLWESTKDHSQWFPEFLYCGSFDYKLEAFPVKTLKGAHHLWIPAEWKFGLRLLNHVMYCMWHTSLDRRLPDGLRCLLARTGEYAEHLRSGFFDEVLEYWYPPGTQLPTNEQPTRQNHPLHSCYLTSFLVNMFNKNSPIPATGVGLQGWESDPATFDWGRWAMKNPMTRSLYGALPPVGTEEYKLLLEESRIARLPNTPSVEIDSSSWSRHASDLVAYMDRKRYRSAIPAVPSRCFQTGESDAIESLTTSPGQKTKRRRMA